VSDERWITFDCYGTLLDWQTAFRRILEPVADGRIEDLVHAFHAVEPEVQRDMPTASYKAILLEGAARAAQRAGIDLAPADQERLVGDWSTIEAFPDTPAALNALRDAGWRLGILTNCDTDLFESTRAALGAEIDLVVTAEETRSYKPALGHFTAFEGRSGVARANWVHAAVAWWHDMVPARDLGLRRVWVDRERTGQDASIVTAHIHDMASLPATVASL
jgi:2-haloacid dehalogenase